MKATSFEIQIPSKCTVSESNFRPHEKGDWCLSCRKTVVDFTEMSDADIIRYFHDKPAGESNCGRWREDQLNKSYRPNPVYQTSNGWWPVVLGSFLSIVSVGKSNGQATDPLSWKPIHMESNAHSGNTTSSAPETPSSMVKDTNSNGAIKSGFRKITVRLRVKGIISGKTSRPRMGYCRETSEKFTADENGNFSLTVPDSAKEMTYTILIHTRNHISDAGYHLKIVPGKSKYRLRVSKEKRRRRGTTAGTYAIVTDLKQSMWQRMIGLFISKSQQEQTSV